MQKRTGKLKITPNKIAIYHVVKANETFLYSANTIFELVSSVKQKYKNKEIHLYVDIEGHKNINGGFDHDMFELQQNFLTGFLLKYIDELNIPLGTVRNKQPLKEMPSKLSIQ